MTTRPTGKSFQEFRQAAAAAKPDPTPADASSNAGAADDALDDAAVSCSQCLAYHPDPAPATVGECRRHAPRPMLGDVNGLRWPVVDADDWCLQHRQREAPFNLTFAPSGATIEPRDPHED